MTDIPRIDPNDDGKTHVNVYSRGKTELGRLLTNFAFTPFKHPRYGHFASMEAFWFWLGTGCKHNQLRRLYGASARSAGKTFERVQADNFNAEINEATELKIRQTSEITRLMALVKPLPLLHYYTYGYGSSPARVIPKPEHSWQLEPIARIWEEIYLKHNPIQSVGELTHVQT